MSAAIPEHDAPAGQRRYRPRMRMLAPASALPLECRGEAAVVGPHRGVLAAGGRCWD